MNEPVIRLAHGFGGRLTQELLDEVIIPALSGKNEHATTLDAAVLPELAPPVVVSTDPAIAARLWRVTSSPICSTQSNRTSISLWTASTLQPQIESWGWF